MTSRTTAPVRPRLVMCCHYFPPHVGGVETVGAELARRLAAHYELTVITSQVRNAPPRETRDGYTVVRLAAVHAPAGIGVPYPVLTGAGLRELLRAPRPDVVIVHGALYMTSWLGAWLARSRVPLVLVEHVGEIAYARAILNAVQAGAWHTAGVRMLRRANAVVTLNARVSAFIRQRCPDADVREIPNGVDVDRFAPVSAEAQRAARERFGLPLDRRVLLVAARAAEKKHVDDVLAADRGDATLVVCGATRGLRGEGLVDLGIVPHELMPSLLASCDALVHAATGEGFPVVVQEAMASGRPVVLRWDDAYASRVDRNAVRAYDGHELSAALAALAGDSEGASMLGRRAREFAESAWSWSRATDAYVHLLEALRTTVRGPQ